MNVAEVLFRDRVISMTSLLKPTYDNTTAVTILDCSPGKGTLDAFSFGLDCFECGPVRSYIICMSIGTKPNLRYSSRLQRKDLSLFYIYISLNFI